MEGWDLTGRQLLWHIYQHYRTSDDVGAVHGIMDLVALQLKGENLDSFYHSWLMLIAGMKRVPTDEDLAEILYEQLRHR